MIRSSSHDMNNIIGKLVKKIQSKQIQERFQKRIIEDCGQNVKKCTDDKW